MKKLLIALDADGVLRNFIAGALAVIKEVTGKTFASIDVTRFNFSKALGLTEDEKRAVMTVISTRRGFVTALPSYLGARQGVRRLRDLGDVFCVTAPWESPWGTNPWWRAESEAWLALHFGIDNVQHAHDKDAYEADVFVDDRAKNVRAWAAAWPGRCAVFWRTPQNSSESVPVGAHSIASWDALYQIAREVAKGPVQLTLPTEEALA
jgi:5'(3')-deoxyribonucleotidase